MKSSGGKILIIAVCFSALFAIDSGAQASSLFALDRNPGPAERQIGLFQQALQWLGGTWTDLKVAFSEDEAPPPPTPTCTNPSGCADDDGGWTIDPDG
jgi:hypothetical protein